MTVAACNAQPDVTRGSGNRTRPSAPVYRALMSVIESRRLERQLSMAETEKISGLQDGFYPKMIYPDTPSGRQARWETVQLVIEALFGENFTVKIAADDDENRRLLSALRMSPAAAAHGNKIRRFRDRKHFEDLGRSGGKARGQLPKRKLAAIGRKAANVRWKRARAAQRAGDAHKAANAEKRAT